MKVIGMTKQRRVVNNKDGTKVLQERIIETLEDLYEDSNVAVWDWEDICTITKEMQKEPTVVLNCITNWLSKEG